MANEVAATVVEAGLIESDTLRQLQRWGAPIPTFVPNELPDPMLIPSLIEHAMQEEEYVLTRETDLEGIPQFLKTQRAGILHIEDSRGLAYDIEVTFGRTLTGEYLFPWQTRGDLADALISQNSYLLYDDTRVFFKDARDLYFGDKVAFVACTPE